MYRIKIGLQKVLKRGALPVVFLFFLFVLCPISSYSQESDVPAVLTDSQTTVSNNGILMTVPITEKVAEEDVQRINELNRDSILEYQSANKIESKSDSSSENEISENETFGDDDFDNLFTEESDMENAVTTATTETVKVDPKDKPITFSGSLKAEMGGYLWFYPWEQTMPLASFRNILKFTGRPATDLLVVGSLLTDFQDMEKGLELDIGVYELYFDYTLFGLVDIIAGKRDLSWSISRMLDTNILDDKKSAATITEDDILSDIFNKRSRTTKDSRFTVSFNVPIFSYGSIQGVSQYYLIDDITEFNSGNISLAGKIEGTIGKFSLAVFGMRWPTDLPSKERMNPALGLNFVSSILGKDSNLFLQGMIHIDTESEYKFNRSRVTAGVYKYFPNPVMLGLAAEYQGIWDEAYGDVESFHQWQHYFAAQIAWSRFIFNRKWTFGCEWFHDTREEYGSILAVMKVEDIVKYTDFRVAVPIYYGSQEKYGLIFELIVKFNY